METKKMKSKEGMMDNRKVSDAHQKGIERITGIGKDMCKGKGGKLGQSGSADYSRGAGETPRRA